MDKRGTRLGLWLSIALVLSTLSTIFVDADVDPPRRPLAADPDRVWANFPPAEPPTGPLSGEPVAEVEVAESKWTDDVIGTAFAVGPHLWVSAAHVFKACSKSYIRVHDKWLSANWVEFHPTADIAVVHTSVKELPPALGVTERPPVLNQSGFHYGYPQGEPGSIHSRFIGEARIRAGKPGTPIERGWIWAEQSRTFDQGSIGGISGGPQVDRTGAVQGVTILEWPRTGRVVTAPVEKLREILPTDFKPVGTGGTSIDSINYPRHGIQARGSDAVAFVLCSLTGKTKLRGIAR